MRHKIIETQSFCFDLKLQEVDEKNDVIWVKAVNHENEVVTMELRRDNVIALALEVSKKELLRLK